jgi:enoyl-CoA hydratase/carnithine racemase
LDRPDQRNAVSAALLGELAAALGRLAVDPGVRAVILSGEGPDFCAGADIEELRTARAAAKGAPVDYARGLEDVLWAIECLPVPVIAQVHGAALGAGCQIVLACDLAVAARDARFGIPSSRLGIVIAYQSIERLLLAVGPKRAGEMLYASRVVSGEEAAAWGLVNGAVPPEEVGSAADALARTLAEGAPLSVRGSKRGIGLAMQGLRLDRFAEGDLAGDFEMMAAEAFASQDLGEGLQAFRERRPPRFTGS